MPIAGEVAIIGSSTTAFGVHHDRGYLDLLAEAAFGAVADAGLDLDRIGSAWLGTAEPGLTGLVGDSGGAVAEAIGFAPRPVTRVANFCCTGMEAVRAAALDVAAGEHELVLAVGAEKMRDVTSRGSLVARTANLTHPTIAKGRTAPGQFALLANAYMERWGTSRETLARVAVKNHEHATRNPKAHFRSPITVEDVLAAPLVAEPSGRSTARRRPTAPRPSSSPRWSGRAPTPSTTSSSAASALPSPRGTTRPSSTRRTTSWASAHARGGCRRVRGRPGSAIRAASSTSSSATTASR